MKSALFSLLAVLLPTDEVGDLLRTLGSPSGQARRLAERALRRVLGPEDLPRVEEALRSGDPELRRRVARVLGSRPLYLPYLFRACASAEGAVRDVAEEALRLFLASGTRPLAEPALEKSGRADIGPATGAIVAGYGGETISRFLEDLNRFVPLDEPILLDPAATGETEPRFPAGEMGGSLADVVERVAESASLRWQVFPSFHLLTPRSYADGGEVVVAFARALESGEAPARRTAAVGLALLGLPAADAVLAKEVEAGGERAREALLGLCAPCGRVVSPALRSPAMIERLLDALESGDADLRRGAAHALRALVGPDPGAAEAALSRLEGAAGGVRASLLRILGAARGPGLLALLEGEVGSEDPLVAAAALEALADAGRFPAAEAMAALVRAGRPRVLLHAVERTLRGARPTVEELSPLLDSGDPVLRRLGGRVLPSCGEEGASKVWAECAEEDDPSSLAALARAARREADLRGDEPLAKALPGALSSRPSGIGRLRIGVAAGLASAGRIPPDLAAALLRSALDEKDPLGDLAALAFGEACGEEGEGGTGGGRPAGIEGRDRLLAELGAASPRVRLRIASALGRCLHAGSGRAVGAGLDHVLRRMSEVPSPPLGAPGPEELKARVLEGLGGEPEVLRGRDPLADFLDPRG